MHTKTYNGKCAPQLLSRRTALLLFLLLLFAIKYRVIQDEKSIFSEVVLPDIVIKNVGRNMYIILNSYQDRVFESINIKAL
jgi:hypothetical protein